MFVTGIVKPFAEVATVLVLLFVGNEHALTTLTIIWLVLIAPWITFALRTARGYQTVPPREPAADAEAPADLEAIAVNDEAARGEAVATRARAD